MQAQYDTALEWLESYPELYTFISVVLLLLAAWLANWVVKRVLVRGLYSALRATPMGDDAALFDSRIIARLANIVPSVIISLGIGFIAGLPEELVIVVRNVCQSVITLVVAMALSGVLSPVGTLYERRPKARIKPIKGYVQVVKIVV